VRLPLPRLFAFACGLTGLAALGGCGGSSAGTTTPGTDPNVFLVVQSQRLVTVSTRFCHVQGTARNFADQPLSGTIRWQAFDADDKPIATTAVVLNQVPAGGSVDFDATALFNQDGLVPCDRIARIERIVPTPTALQPRR
jgi:hypothetical protein